MFSKDVLLEVLLSKETITSSSSMVWIAARRSASVSASASGSGLPTVSSSAASEMIDGAAEPARLVELRVARALGAGVGVVLFALGFVIVVAEDAVARVVVFAGVFFAAEALVVLALLSLLVVVAAARVARFGGILEIRR